MGSRSHHENQGNAADQLWCKPDHTSQVTVKESPDTGMSSTSIKAKRKCSLERHLCLENTSNAFKFCDTITVMAQMSKRLEGLADTVSNKKLPEISLEGGPVWFINDMGHP